MPSLTLRRHLAPLWTDPGKASETSMELRKNGHQVVGFRRSHRLQGAAAEAPPRALFEAGIQGLLGTLERAPVWTKEREAGPDAREVRVRLRDAPGGFGTLIARFQLRAGTLTQSVVYLADDADAEEEAGSFLDSHPPP